ncbi:hypothetical protein NEPTK9_001312 [Candidatus Neptunochlamydia vexilliferae]|uniref:Uncharacterized protein n=2 Tax=Candidatus Neptunichlamydia vexilliferae TaxID=1651774 RepID=A0ABS0B087_9BACT|nr:hypothetical protein [Candidatus Neptunochlamydia vexilliferae]
MGETQEKNHMPEPRTIDNLGVETSVRWAQDQAYLDKTFTKESPFISLSTSVDVAAPFFESEFDSLFQTNQRLAPWAFLLAPKGYNLQKMRLFTFQTIPSLGTEEFLTAQAQKIQDKVEAAKKQRAERRKTGKGSEYAWEDEREEEEEVRESKTLLALLDYLQMADTLLGEINGRRNQYSKG